MGRDGCLALSFPPPPLFACSFEKGLWRQRRRRRRTSGGLLPPTQCIHTGRSFPPSSLYWWFLPWRRRKAALGKREGRREGASPLLPPLSRGTDDEHSAHHFVLLVASSFSSAFRSLLLLLSRTGRGKKQRWYFDTRAPTKEKGGTFFWEKESNWLFSPFRFAVKCRAKDIYPRPPPPLWSYQRRTKKDFPCLGKEGVEGFLYTNLQQNHG